MFRSGDIGSFYALMTYIPLRYVMNNFFLILQVPIDIVGFFSDSGIDWDFHELPGNGYNI